MYVCPLNRDIYIYIYIYISGNFVLKPAANLNGRHREVRETIKKMVTKCAICAQVLDFSGQSNVRNDLLAYGFCRIEINETFPYQVYIVARL